MIEDKIRTYKTENPLILEEVNEFLNKKGEYGFDEGDDKSNILYFFDRTNIFAITHTDGRIELEPNVNPLIINYIEKKLNIKKSRQ